MWEKYLFMALNTIARNIEYVLKNAKCTQRIQTMILAVFFYFTYRYT